MTREEEIHKIANTISTNIGKDVDEDYICNDEYDFTIGFECGAKWADEHPDSKHTYTKQQLIGMGFAFTINGDIVTPDQLNEDLKKYLEYQKQKFIEKAKEWLEKTLYIHTEIVEVKYWCETKSFDWVTSDYDSVEDFINGFCKAMEE